MGKRFFKGWKLYNTFLKNIFWRFKQKILKIFFKKGAKTDSGQFRQNWPIHRRRKTVFGEANNDESDV